MTKTADLIQEQKKVREWIFDKFGVMIKTEFAGSECEDITIRYAEQARQEERAKMEKLAESAVVLSRKLGESAERTKWEQKIRDRVKGLKKEIMLKDKVVTASTFDDSPEDHWTVKEILILELESLLPHKAEK